MIISYLGLVCTYLSQWMCTLIFVVELLYLLFVLVTLEVPSVFYFILIYLCLSDFAVCIIYDVDVVEESLSRGSAHSFLYGLVNLSQPTFFGIWNLCKWPNIDGF